MTEHSTAATKVIDYHERTKHRFDGYARGPETIDWDAQPDPFRRFDGAPQRELPLQNANAAPSYASLFSGQEAAVQPWSETTISRLLQFSLALAAWKQYGTSRWSLRCNPSSGNLHPTESYLILIGIEGFENGLYHYRVDRHQLELRCRYGTVTDVTGPLLLLGFSSVHWREAWKYGERGYRYCQLDLGHALAAVTFSSTLLGYRVTRLKEVGTTMLQRLLGLDRSDEFFPDEAEHGDMLLAFHPATEPPESPIGALLKASAEARWYGRANRLDPRHLYDWPVIAEVAEAAQRPADSSEPYEAEQWASPIPAADHPLSQQSALKLFQQRRSAQAFDPDGSIPIEDFYRLMDRLLPRSDLPPWSSQAWPPRVHLALFIHGVEGLATGLYLLARRHVAPDELKTLLRDDLLWEPVEDAPSHLPFYCLARAKARQAAMQLGCHQAIAGDSAFSLAMLAELEPAVSQASWLYNELLWEAGMIGQTLYLEAEAIGMRGTGIGCFFDDGVHEMLGIQGKALQAVYHFTVGAPLSDPRLATLPPYPNQRNQAGISVG